MGGQLWLFVGRSIANAEGVGICAKRLAAIAILWAFANLDVSKRLRFTLLDHNRVIALTYANVVGYPSRSCRELDRETYLSAAQQE